MEWLSLIYETRRRFSLHAAEMRRHWGISPTEILPKEKYAQTTLSRTMLKGLSELGSLMPVDQVRQALLRRISS